ncbi:MAG: hypothetical protein J3K34DRAFT_512230 [Monoraphidium minutum]|nr:MAG: hypothetical protein J3K34DRAFT_512230 [Monoraphidium minutum]
MATFADNTGGLTPGLSEMQQAVEDLRKAQQDLSGDTRQHAYSKLLEAKAAVDNGAGENDLKRLQRKFQATKASYINVDVKERFMQSLRDGTLEVAALEETHRGLEEQLQRDAEGLRSLKDQNLQARQALQDTSAQIATMHQQFEQVMGDVAGQLDALERSLQQFDATRPPAPEPLGDGPDQAECDALLREEMGRAKQLEAAIASSEAAIQEAEPAVRGDAQELAALQEEVARVSALQAESARTADASAHLSRAAKWAVAAAAAVESLGGVSIDRIGEGQLALTITCCVPTSLAEGAPLREERHELSLQLRPGSALLASARLSPARVPIDDIAAAAATGAGGGVRSVVGQVQLRLLQYWGLQALVEAAAERYPLVRVEQQREGGGGAPAAPGRVLEAALPSRPGLKVQVAVPAGWPRLGGAAGAGGGEGLRLAGAAGGGVDGGALVAAVNGDAAAAGLDLLGFLGAVAARAEAM